MSRVSAPRALRPSRRTTQLASEGALDVAARARALERSGREILHLEIGEPSFPTPAHIVEAAARALAAGDTRYGPAAGLPELREAICASLAERGVQAEPEEVVVTPGAKTMLFYAVLSVVDPGDEVLVPDPGFPTYPSVVRYAGGTPVSYGLPASASFAPDVDEIAARIGPRTRAIVLNAPHNPTGGSIDAETLARIAELAERHDLAVISDEIYARLHFGAPTDPGAPSIAAIPGLRARTVIVDGFSKTFAMTGWRLGYGVMPRALARHVTTLAINGHTCTPAFVQRAGVAALTGPRAPLDAMREELRRRRDEIVRALATLPGVACPVPAGGFYAFPDLRAVLHPAAITAATLATRLLEEHGVAALAGTAFGARGEGHLRLSFAGAAEDLDRAVARLGECLAAVANSRRNDA